MPSVRVTAGGRLDAAFLATSFASPDPADRFAAQPQAGIGYSIFLAGGGVRGGMTYGSTNDFGEAVAENPVTIHDIHATILHQLGIDHERLTYRHGGRDHRLTDVHGRVVAELLAAPPASRRE